MIIASFMLMEPVENVLNVARLGPLRSWGTTKKNVGSISSGRANMLKKRIILQGMVVVCARLEFHVKIPYRLSRPERL